MITKQQSHQPILRSANVGIGTTTSAQKLEISGSSPVGQMSDTAALGILVLLSLQ